MNHVSQGRTRTLHGARLGVALALVGLAALGACDDGRAVDADGGEGSDAGPVTGEPLRATWTRLDVTGGPEARPRPALAALGDDVVLFGGGPPRRGDQLGDTWVFAGGAWRRVDVTPSPPARTEAVMVPFEGRVLLFGGLGVDAGGDLTVFADTWAFDGERWEELPVSVAPATRGGGAGAAGDRVVAFGGLDDDLTRVASTFVFDGASWTEQVLVPSPPAVRDTAMASDGTYGYFTGGSAPAAVSAVWRCDGVEWERVGEIPTGRAYHAAGTLAGRLVVFGGVQTSTTHLAATEAWPGPIELTGPEPAPSSSYTMATRGSDIVMWGDDPPQLWTLTVAE